MTIRYKNQGFKQAGTGATTVFTAPADSTVIIKSIYCSNNDASSAIEVSAELTDSSASVDYEFFRDSLAAKSQVNATPAGLNLEASDGIKITAGTGSNKIQGVISYAILDRSQENG